MAVSRRVVCRGALLSIATSGLSACSSIHDDLAFVCDVPNSLTNDYEQFGSETIDVGYSRHFFDEENDYDLFQLSRRRDAWKTNSSGKATFSIKFLDGTSLQKEFVRSVFSEWLDPCAGLNVNFTSQASADVRISFKTKKSYSLIGINALREKNQDIPTMGLSRLDVSSISKSRHKVLHECGHALGLRHEHRHPNGGILWDKKVVVEEQKSKGFRVDQVYSQIFNKLSKSYLCPGAEEFDVNSVMIYPIPNHWTKNNFTTGVVDRLSEGDHRCVSNLYGC